MGKDLIRLDMAGEGGDATLDDRLRAFGREMLGPVMAGYLARLWRRIRAFEDERGARALYVTRAGVRIRRALAAYCAATGLPMPPTGETFHISRLMVCKGVWRRDRALAEALMVEIFGDRSLMEACGALLRASDVEAPESLLDPDDRRRSTDLPAFLAGEGLLADTVRGHLDAQSALFERYLEGLAPPETPILLIDTGWQGTIQRLLTRACPEREIWGVYFGRYGTAQTDRSCWPRAIGLCFEKDAVDPSDPATALLEHRHLIEHLLEPKGDSVEELIETDGRITCRQEAAFAEDSAQPADPVFRGVLEHLDTLSPRDTVAEVERRYAEGWRRLARHILLPTREEAELALGMERSHDFGRVGASRVLLDPENLPAEGYQSDARTPEDRVAKALWQPGQVALDYAPEVARQINAKRFGLPLDAFTPEALARAVAAPAVPMAPDRPKVAVVTRTMDRPNFLRRAVASVGAQTFGDFVHVVVCDGGDAEEARAAIAACDVDQSRILLVDNVVNRGMEAASNIAIETVDSDYIVIHDDDDSWEPDFLARAVAFLERDAQGLYAGVVTHSTYVSEQVAPDGSIQVHARYPYNQWLTSLHAFQLAMGNPFPPIAFLVRRRAWQAVGGFNADYPVLGDWDFNIRVLRHGEIGVIPEPLANYHHRDVGDTLSFGNSVISGRDKHGEYAPIVRNALVRAAERGEVDPSVSTMLGIGLHFDALLNQVRQLASRPQAESRVVEVPRPEPVSSGAGRMADAYWCALQTLTRAVAAGDETVLATVREAMADEALDETARLAFVTQSLAERPGGGRAAAPDFDAAAYLAAHPEVRAAVDEGAVASPYEHYLRIGHARGHPRPGRGGQATVAGVSVYGPGPIRPGDGAVRLSEALQGAPRLLVARPEFQFDLLRMHDDGFLLHPTQWGTSTVAMTLRFPRPVRWIAMRLEAIDGRSLPISFAMRALPGAYPDEAIDPDLSADLTLADPDLLAQLAWTRLVPASSRPVTVEFKTPATEAKLVFATKVDGVEYFSHAHFSNLFFF